MKTLRFLDKGRGVVHRLVRLVWGGGVPGTLPFFLEGEGKKRFT